ncbi:MAG: hypothetical protein L7V86_01330 [Verrucomicrobiales bacterium]|jgi:hypothetical protein|nr:hypothetical protein [Verrucomicrobiales bacterium]MDB2346323.1 hypothetical protein [Verrucomicrobiales bacterium]MDB4772763.1 hypothetical protein [Verrucomicrobiales bacterium]MDF1784534.1 hypothetical protein [Verrucomicrobiales bacterium]
MAVSLSSQLYEPTDYYKSDVPEGVSGEWEVKRFTLPVVPAGQISEASPEVPHWMLHRPGRYTRLKVGGIDMMTDLYEEWWSQREAITEGLQRGGHILISGLGLGMIIECLLRPETSPVERITVLEQSADVITLVAPHLQARYGERLEILHTSVFEWAPPAAAHYSVTWHDIWPKPDAAYRHEITVLESKFARCSDWQGTWTQESYAV